MGKYKVIHEDIENIDKEKVAKRTQLSLIAIVLIVLGVAMLSSVLNSKAAIQVNMGIMRAFVAVRQMISLPSATQFLQLQNEVKELKDYLFL